MTLRMPGSTLMSRLKVYDTPTPDGQRGGTPHVHLLCTEMYFVLAGSGAVEMIDTRGFSRVELGQNAALLFSPGTIHRLINPNGDLEILVIMQNSGLPERGDNVVCFTEVYMNSDEIYGAAMKVSNLEEAYLRRDRGVEGFLLLKAAFEQSLESGCTALEHFYQLAEKRTEPFRAEWSRLVQTGAVTAVNETLSQLDALQNHDISHLFQAQNQLIPPSDTRSLGFCGHLNRYFDPATLRPEGTATP
jgi:mannose-6-phosphate isomerase-like protein (cupin superfamily)